MTKRAQTYKRVKFELMASEGLSETGIRTTNLNRSYSRTFFDSDNAGAQIRKLLTESAILQPTELSIKKISDGK